MFMSNNLGTQSGAAPQTLGSVEAAVDKSAATVDAMAAGSLAGPQGGWVCCRLAELAPDCMPQHAAVTAVQKHADQSVHLTRARKFAVCCLRALHPFIL